MDYMTNRMNLCVYTRAHIISFVYLWIKNRMLQHLFYHFWSPWGIVTFGTFIFPVKRWFLNCLKQVEEIFSRMFTVWQLYIGEGKGERVWTGTESQEFITFLSSVQSNIQAEKKNHSTVELIIIYRFKRGHRPLVTSFGSAPKSGVSTCKYGQPSFCPAWNANLDILPHSFP